MVDNSGGLSIPIEVSRAEFIELSGVCESREEEDGFSSCARLNNYACKDYLCPKLRSADTIEEARRMFVKTGG